MRYYFNEYAYDALKDKLYKASQYFDSLVNRYDGKFHNAEELKKCLSCMNQIIGDVNVELEEE